MTNRPVRAALVATTGWILGCSSASRPEAQPDYNPPENPGGAPSFTGATSFTDEFDAGAPSAADYYFYPGWGDAQNPAEDPAFVEGQTATAGLSGFDARAVTIANGLLEITGSQQTTRYGGQNFPYRGGMIRTKASYLYGYFEIRAKMAAGQGLYSAFWLMPSRFDDVDIWEIDVAEVPGTANSRVYMNRHWGYGYGTPNHHQNMSSVDGDFSDGFHVFAVRWTGVEVTWFIDGVQRYQLTDHVPNVPMQVLLTFAVGGPNGWVNAFDGTTSLPKALEVDYLRISRTH
jgi:beta-glucanase (GH16 family)